MKLSLSGLNTTWHAVWMVDLCDPSETSAVSTQLFKANGHFHPTALSHAQEQE